MFQNKQPNWNETDVNSDAYIQNKPNIPVLKNADWDESDSSDGGYILGNPTKEVNKGLDIKATLTSGNTVTNVSQLKVPTSLDGSYSFGATQGNMNISGLNTTIYGSQGGTIYLTASDGINIVPRYSYVGVKYNGNSINTAGGFAIVGDNGKLPASIVPAAGYSYDTITNYTLSSGHTYLLDDMARNNAQNANHYALSMPYDNDEVEVHFLVENGNSWGHFSIGDFRFGYNNSDNGYLRQWTPGFYKYKFRKESDTIKLYNDNGQIIATDASLWGSDGVSVYSIFCNSNGSSEENGAIPLSNDYIPMPCGGYATPVLQGQSLFGIDFDYDSSGGTVDLAYFGNNYMHVFSTHPVCLMKGNTISNFLCFNTIAEPVTITFVGNGNGTAHVYMNYDSDDLFDSSYTTIGSYRVVRLTTWCSCLGSTWLRYFIKEGSNNVWYQEYQTMPAQRT